jgi:uncharacterized protein YodC (DUF2158 family)
MAEMKFTVGDVVRLKSGGPTMTVQSAQYADEVVCTWFGEKNKREFSPFHQDTLEKFEPGSPI